MNELEYYDATLPRAVQGWSTIMCTHGGDHAYVANWWPDAHPIGYEHLFTNQAFDILKVLAGEAPTVPMPDFDDAYQTQRVLEAAMISAEQRRPVMLEEVEVAFFIASRKRPLCGSQHVRRATRASWAEGFCP